MQARLRNQIPRIEEQNEASLQYEAASLKVDAALKDDYVSQEEDVKVLRLPQRVSLSLLPKATSQYQVDSKDKAISVYHNTNMPPWVAASPDEDASKYEVALQDETALQIEASL